MVLFGGLCKTMKCVLMSAEQSSYLWEHDEVNLPKGYISFAWLMQVLV